MKKMSTAITVIMGILCVGSFILGLGGAGVLNDLYFELENLEKGITPPPLAIVTGMTIDELKDYIDDTNKSVAITTYCFYFFSAIFLARILYSGVCVIRTRLRKRQKIIPE